MGKLEQGTIKEFMPLQESAVPAEVLEMDENIIGEAKDVFGENHKLVVEAMTGVGRRKAKEFLDDLSQCRLATRDVIKKFKTEKERIYH